MTFSKEWILEHHGKLRASLLRQIELLESGEMAVHGDGPGEKMHDITPQAIQQCRDQLATIDEVDRHIKAS
jgi:hypothetical protein